MSSLYFEKISRFDRSAEPVTVSIPFAQGALKQPEQLRVLAGERPLALQTRPLAHWPDGSVKWLLVHMQPDLPGNQDLSLRFEVDPQAEPVQPEARVSVNAESDGLHVSTGPLAFRIPRQGYWPVADVQLNGQALFGAQPFSGFELQVDGQRLTSAAEAPLEIEIEEAGPLRAVILVRGMHVPLASPPAEDTLHAAALPGGQAGEAASSSAPRLELRGRITAYAGKPYIEVEHQFIHVDPQAAPYEFWEMQKIALRFTPAEVQGQPHFALGQGFYRTAIQQGGGEGQPDSLQMALTTETLLYQSNEHFVDSFYGDFWIDWRDAQGGLALSVYQAHQNFPKTLRVDAEGMDVLLYPEDAPPAPFLQGMAKTHRLLLHFHAADTPLEDLSTRSLQFQLPDRPALPRAWYRENNPWLETFFPEHIPGRLMNYLTELHDNRPSGMGMFHFGDAPDSGYTNQGRGSGQSVWVNNEYDRPHAAALFYALSGQRRMLDSSLTAARHWLDVDLCHFSEDPLLNGGLKIHTAYHVTGRVTPSHEWLEGMLDYYFLTGRAEGLQAARSVAENIMRHMARPEMRAPGEFATREGGWALRAMVGMYLGTGEEKWRAEAQRLVEMFLDWYDRYGALLAPYTSHSMPRVPFMIALTVNSFARYLLIEEDERVKKLIVETVDDLLEHCIGPSGIAYYKELPSLRRTSATPHLPEALTHAFRVTGDERYLKIAARQFSAIPFDETGRESNVKYADPSGAVVLGKGRARTFDDRYTSLILFASEAAPRGFLDWFEYPFDTV